MSFKYLLMLKVLILLNFLLSSVRRLSIWFIDLFASWWAHPRLSEPIHKQTWQSKHVRKNPLSETSGERPAVVCNLEGYELLTLSGDSRLVQQRGQHVKRMLTSVVSVFSASLLIAWIIYLNSLLYKLQQNKETQAKAGVFWCSTPTPNVLLFLLKAEHFFLSQCWVPHLSQLWLFFREACFFSWCVSFPVLLSSPSPDVDTSHLQQLCWNRLDADLKTRAKVS